MRERASYAFAIGSVAAALDVEAGVVREARLAFGAVASRPWRARAAEAVLTGAPADGETFAAAADAELAAARPLPDNGYKVTLMRNLVVAVLTELAEETAR
ncbi:CO/xanthine dehydrogenase FAD-binding subunit [Streptomyces tendae]